MVTCPGDKPLRPQNPFNINSLAMENLFTQKKPKNHFFHFAVPLLPGLTKPCSAFVLALVLTTAYAYAQAPSIHYPSTPETYTPDLPITPLTPTASGVAAYGYSNNPQLYGPGINQPYGVAVDAAGNIYVADTYNNLVKKVDPVSGHAVVLGAGFNMPYDVVLDAAGNIYVADYGNNAVKKILATGGATVTIGSGFNKPSGLAFDAAGNLYVADGGNNAVKKINLSTGKIVSLGFGFKSPSGVAVDKAGNVYVTDTGNSMVKKIPIDGGPTAEFYSGFTTPRGIVIDPSGNIFIVDGATFYNILFEISPGSPYPLRMSIADGSYGIAVDALGDIYGASPSANDIYEFKYDVYEGTPVYLGNPIVEGLSSLSGVTIDHEDNIFLAAVTAKEMPAGYENPVDLYDFYNDNNMPARGIAVDAADNLFGTDVTNNVINELLPYPNSYISVVASGFNQPSGIAVDSKHQLYVADTKNNVVKQVTNYFKISTLASGFNSPAGVAVDSSGNVYVADTYNNAVKKIAAGTTSAVTIGSGFNLPYGITVDNQGNLFVTDVGDGTVKKMPVTGGTPVTIGSGFVKPEGVAVDVEGDVYVADAGDLSLKKIVPTGGFHISPHLPQGLTFNENTGVISGTPTVNSPLTPYTITAYNASGPAETYVLIAVTGKADLAKLQVSAGKLSPPFVRNLTSYADTVAGTIAMFTVTPRASSALATITVNGMAVASGSSAPAIPLAEGSNTITTTVTAADGSTSKTYTLTVFRPFSNDANLSFMQPSAGMMSPLFTPAITSYTDTVNYTNQTIQITPVANDSLATIKVNGVAVASGALSQSIPLKQGLNTITTVVTAPDGHTTKTFTISVMRAFSTDAYLTQMQPGAGHLSPVFNPMTNSYTDEVNNSHAAITITPAVDDPLATLTVNGAHLASGATSPPIPLSVGPNTITTVVTAPDGVTTKTYTLTVTRDAFTLTSFNSAYQPVGVAQVVDEPLLPDDGIQVHQGVSPNGDGINDFLQIDNISQYPDNKLAIMNRNGQLIFEAKGYDNSSKVFDGHSNKNGQMQLPGTYFYQLDYTVGSITNINPDL